jgi:hypothetical protein
MFCSTIHGSVKKYVVFNNQVTTSTKKQENPNMIDLESSWSILNQKKILGLKENLKQS